ncbi:hypothetical protein CLOSTHATH_01254 [Hungatella hathewayi DSM 13479]|uniref:Uncharacterized protein n=1 Tax=Hungatella hathewayi DSM 13479 TaxID=566550 RepID=D3ACC7_9FIRM|nr:hypothetical protein CLOSTHATH_01254 [Hungatella hathewayi DSM 13479]
MYHSSTFLLYFYLFSALLSVSAFLQLYRIREQIVNSGRHGNPLANRAKTVIIINICKVSRKGTGKGGAVC